MKKNILGLALSAVSIAAAPALLLSPLGLHAQTDLGRISGVVTDASGAVVRGASVSVANDATGVVRNFTTNSTGEYTAVGLTPGNYTVTISASGFGDTTKKLSVSVGSQSVVNAQLGAQNVSTSVDVAADNVAGIQLEHGEVSQVITGQQILELPSLGRDPYSFVALSGNVGADTSAASRGVGVNFSGSRSASTDILLDGVENTDLYAVGVATPIPLDAVAEYRVITAGFGAEYGRASGGIVNVASRSGTNKFHGTAYEFNRISALASNGYNDKAIGNPKAVFVRNTFGGSIGGPVVKDKLFFFDNLEFDRIRSSANVQAAIPSAQLIAASNANTQAFFAAYGQQRSGLKAVSTVNGGNGYSVGQVLSSGFTTAAADPKFAALGSNFHAFDVVTYSVPADSGAGAPSNSYNNIARIDYALSQKTQMFGRYIVYSDTAFNGTNSQSPYSGYDTGSTNFNNNGMLSVTHTFSARLTETTRLLYNRTNNSQPLNPSRPVQPTLYTNPSGAPSVGGFAVNFPGYYQLSPGNSIPFGGPQNFTQIGEDLTLVSGRHNIRLGGNYMYLQDNRVFGAYENAVNTLVSTGTKGALNNFLNGNIAIVQVAVDPKGAYPCVRSTATGAYTVTSACTLNLPISPPNFSRSNRFHDGNAFAVDSFKLTPRLTIEAGVRWEYYGVQHSNHPNLDSNFFFGSGATLIDRIRTGNLQTRLTSPGGNLWKPNKSQFSPHLSFAYDLTGDGKTALRGSYGMSYERNFGNVTFNVIQNPPNYGVVSFQAGVDAPTIPLLANNLNTFGSGTGTKFLPNVNLRAVNPNIKPAYNHFYTATIERQLTPNTSVGVTYTGERGIHNYSISGVNRPQSGYAYLGDGYSTSRINQQYGSINLRDANGDSYYNGLNVNFRSSNLRNYGITTTVNYTYAQSTDDTSSTFTDGQSNGTGGGGIAYLDPFNPALDHGWSDFDQRHRIAVGMTYEVPVIHSASGLVKTLLGGFEANAVFTASTGNPFTVFDCNNAGYTACPRAIFNQPFTYKRTRNLVDVYKNGFQGAAGTAVVPGASYGPNTFSYISYPQVNSGGQSVPDTATYFAPKTGTGDFPTCGGLEHIGCAFPSNMTARNAFRGPGVMNGLDASLNKTFHIRETMGLQLRAEFFNLMNHANTFVNLGGTNDVSTLPFVGAYKDGRRQTQLAAKFLF